MTPAAVFLDRDGTVNVKADDDSYVTRPDALRLLPGAAPAIARLNAAGVPVLLVTNQRGVARGLMGEADLVAVHDRLGVLLAEHGAHLDGIYACVHGHDSCDCRKPLPGLVRTALAERPGLRAAETVVIGDSAVDVGLARAAGARAIRIAPAPDPLADATVPNLEAAVGLLLDPAPEGGPPWPAP